MRTIAWTLALVLCAEGCGARCGPGTRLEGDVCVPDLDAGGSDDASAGSDGGADDGSRDDSGADGRDAGTARDDAGRGASDSGLRPGGPCARAGVTAVCIENRHHQCGVRPDLPEGTLELIQDSDWLGGRCEEDVDAFGEHFAATCLGGGYEACVLSESRPACFDDDTLRSCNGVHWTGRPCDDGHACVVDHCEPAR